MSEENIIFEEYIKVFEEYIKDNFEAIQRLCEWNGFIKDEDIDDSEKTQMQNLRNLGIVKVDEVKGTYVFEDMDIANNLQSLFQAVISHSLSREDDTDDDA